MVSARDSSLEDDNQFKGPSSERANDGREDFLGTQFRNNTLDIDALDLDINSNTSLMSHRKCSTPVVKSQHISVGPSPTRYSPSSLLARGALPAKISDDIEIIDVDAFELSANYASAMSAGYSSPSVKLEQQPLEGVVADQMGDLLKTPPREHIHQSREYGVTVDTSKDAVTAEGLHILKSSDKDVIMIDDDNQPITVKKEEGETINRWQYDPKKPINLVSDDENDGMQISTSMARRRSSSASTSEKISLKGNGSAVPLSNASPVLETLLDTAIPVNNATSSSTDIESTTLTKSLLLNKKRLKLSKERVARIKELQGMLTKNSTLDPVIEVAGTVFHELQQATTASAVKDKQPINEGNGDTDTIAEEEDLYMRMPGAVEGDEGDHAARFAEFKKSYKAKKRTGKTTWEDDVNFIKAEIAEMARLRRLEIDFIHAQGDPEQGCMVNDQTGAPLFMSETSPKAPSLKRPRAATVEDDDDDDAEEVDSESVKRVKPRKITKKQQEKIQKEMMLAGMQADIPKRKGTEYAKIRKTGTKKITSRGKGSKSQSSGGDITKGKSLGTKKPRGEGPKSRAAEPHLMKNVGSLFTSNVYKEANANVGKTVPSMKARKKGQAINQLIASVPLEDRRTASTEKQHILEATKSLGFRKVRPNGDHRWEFKGMKSALLNHQVQGAAWMRERETGGEEPRGGLCSDEMGYGKTVTMLACMVSNPAPPGDVCKTTLVVATPSLVAQWMEELDKHVAPEVLSCVTKYQGKSKALGPRSLEFLKNADVMLTTYSEVCKSYPKNKPPSELISAAARLAWWENEFETKLGFLHKISFYRVVLDEAQAIKNHGSQTSFACRMLRAKHRWAISGTPIQNRIEELFPYLKFLRVPHTGNYEIFKKNFCSKEDTSLCNERLHSFLRRCMIRRTHLDTLFGAPLVIFPRNHQHTALLEFNGVERAIYEIVRSRYIKRINSYAEKGLLEKSYSNVLTMLLRLRQLTCHVLMLQQTIEDLFEVEDIQKLWEDTAQEVTSSDSQDRDMLIQMRKLIANRDALSTAAQGESGESPDSNLSTLGEDDSAQQSRPLIFKFRGILRDLSKSSKWDALRRRSTCHKCDDIPIDPYVTSCLHIYCKECLNAMAIEAATGGEDQTTCLECGTIFTETHPCNGLKELGYDDFVSNSQNGSPKPRHVRRDPEEDTKWINFEGAILPSSKTAAFVAQVEQWAKEEPRAKVIVFTQFHIMIKILAKICSSRGWEYCAYHGRMSHEARDNSIREFRDHEDKRILIASLKCGGVGLNLTMASRVICIDLWWNASVEQQAFCRVFRMGQKSETYITRFIIKNTVDEKLQNMQIEKTEAIDAAMGDDGKRLAKLSLTDLMRLFGPVRKNAGHEAFIIVEDEDELDSTIPPMS